MFVKASNCSSECSLQMLNAKAKGEGAWKISILSPGSFASLHLSLLDFPFPICRLVRCSKNPMEVWVEQLGGGSRFSIRSHISLMIELSLDEICRTSKCAVLCWLVLPPSDLVD